MVDYLKTVVEKVLMCNNTFFVTAKKRNSIEILLGIKKCIEESVKSANF